MSLKKTFLIKEMNGDGFDGIQPPRSGGQDQGWLKAVMRNAIVDEVHPGDDVTVVFITLGNLNIRVELDQDDKLLSADVE